MKILQKSYAKYKVYSFGFLQNGQEIKAYEINNKKGMSLKVIEYGATVVSLKKPLKSGEIVDVVLGFDTLEGYVDSFSLPSAPYFGATVGRYAGRIAKAKFKLNDEIINLNKNNDGNSLHGGYEGFSQKVWNLDCIKTKNNPSITFKYISPNGEELFPGELKVFVTYTLTEENEMIVEYQATTDQDTIVNLTHHSYFNLDGQHSSILEQDLLIDSSEIIEIFRDKIPTGEILNAIDASFDYTQIKSCPAIIDNTYLLRNQHQFAVSLYNKNNNLRLSVYTSQPAVHIYVGG